MEILTKNSMKIKLIIFLSLIWNISFADDKIIFHEKFDKKKSDLKNWKFTPDDSWSVLSKAGPAGDGSLVVRGGTGSHEVSFPVALNSENEQTLRLSIWLKTE